MPVTTYHSTYYDDLNIADSNGRTPLDKNYMRILFKPGYAVQTRELNQLQSLLQTQLDRVGQSIFTNGKPVIGGVCRFDNSSKIYSVLVSSDSDLTLLGISKVNNSSNVNTSNYISSNVVAVKAEDSYYRLYLKSTSAQTSNDNTTNIFKYSPGDILNCYTDDPSVPDGVLAASVLSVGRAVGASVDEGVYFIKGSFVHITQQYIVRDLGDIDLYTGDISLNVEESIVSDSGINADLTLRDNSNGTYNYAQSGADRYAINLTLIFNTSEATNALNLLKIISDKIVTNNTNDIAAGLDDKFAQRTFEESGNYEVNPFPISIREAYNENNNGGYYRTFDELLDNGYTAPTFEEAVNLARQDLAVQLDPSVAYIKGYRVSLDDTLTLKCNKARTVSTRNNVQISASMGSYVDGAFGIGSGIPNIENQTLTYDLIGSSYAGEIVIGTTRIRSIDAISNGYRLFLYDVKINDGYKFSQVSAIIGEYDPAFGAMEFILEVASLKDASSQRGLFELPYFPPQNIYDLSYSQKRSYTDVVSSNSVTFDSNGVAFDKSETSIIVYNDTAGTIIDGSQYDVANDIDSNILTLLFNPGVTTDGDEITVIATVVALATPGVKKLKNATITKAALLSAYDSATQSYILPTVHLYGLTGDALSVFDVFSDGQNSTAYVYAKIKLKSAKTTDDIPSSVTYDYFEFSNGDYFSYDSYYDSRSGTDIKMGYADIPYYLDTPLYNVLDFRYYTLYAPVVKIRPIDPYSTITFNISYYLPRVDIVACNNLGKFYIKAGVPSDKPYAPQIEDNALALYKLYIGAYTFDQNDVVIEKIDNQRYTMSDIRKLDNRITNLEYYTTLSLLEKTANDQKIIDDELAIDRFKNGFVVDDFVGHNVGDPSNPSYICSIDGENNELRPAFTTRSLKLVDDDVSQLSPSGYISGVHQSAYTLPYNEAEYIVQNRASESYSVNPYDLSTFIGTLNLFPASDHWIDTQRRPDLIVKDNSALDAIRVFGQQVDAALTNNGDEIDILGTQWNSWQTVWEGRNRNARENVLLPRARGRVARTTTQVRTGIETSIGSAVQETLIGDNVVDLSIRPYIRSRYVYFKASALKPNTIFTPFFDGVNVSQYVYAVDEATFEKGKNSDVASLNGAPIPQPSGSSQIKSDENGIVYGVFAIPGDDDNETTPRFLTGTRNFRLIDNTQNNTSQSTSYAEAVYAATGSLETKQSTILSTAIPQIVKREVTESRTITRWGDPVAQSFLISNQEGAFVTSVDLYFANIPVSVNNEIPAPVEVYIVPCENGIPTQRIVPFTTVTLPAANVNVSADSSLSTKFTFSQPVYLQPNQEYALVCTSTDSSYRVWISNVGSIDLQGNLISKNPYAGVFFSSQNSSTWTPDQNKDLKFTLNRAQFSTTSRSITLKSEINTGISRIEITNGGSGYTSAPDVIISAPSAGGITATAVAQITNGVVTAVNLVPSVGTDKIIYGGSGYTQIPSITFNGGGGSNAAATAIMNNFPVSSFYLKQDAVNISAVDNNDPTQVIQTSCSNQVELLNASYGVLPGFTYPLDLAKRSYDQSGLSIGNSVKTTTTLYTDSAYLSPVIDRERLSFKVIRNRILDEEARSSKYITRAIQLNSSSDQLDIYFDVNRPSSTCNVIVKGKFVYGETVGDESNVETDWIEISPAFPRTVPVNTNPDAFSEMHYTINPEKDFVEFKVMILFLGSNIVDAPRIKKFRAIATV